MTQVQAGKLRHVVTVQQPQEASNEYGEQELSWADFKADVYASVEPLTGRELFNAQQVQSDVSTRVRLRWFHGLTTRMRIVFGQRIYHIESATNEAERNIVWNCLCREAG